MTCSDVDVAAPPPRSQVTQDMEPLVQTALTATDYWNDSCSIEDLTSLRPGDASVAIPGSEFAAEHNCGFWNSIPGAIGGGS